MAKAVIDMKGSVIAIFTDSTQPVRLVAKYKPGGCLFKFQTLGVPDLWPKPGIWSLAGPSERQRRGSTLRARGHGLTGSAAAGPRTTGPTRRLTPQFPTPPPGVPLLVITNKPRIASQCALLHGAKPIVLKEGVGTSPEELLQAVGTPPHARARGKPERMAGRHPGAHALPTTIDLKRQT